MRNKEMLYYDCITIEVYEFYPYDYGKYKDVYSNS